MSKFWHDFRRVHFPMGCLCLLMVGGIAVLLALPLEAKDEFGRAAGIGAFGSFLFILTVVWSGYRSCYPFKEYKRPPFSQLPEVFYHMTREQRKALRDHASSRSDKPFRMTVEGHEFEFTKAD